MKYPERHLEFINRGISGNAASDLLARWQTDTLEKEPDVLSVLVGVNDCVRESKKQAPDLSAAEYEEYYRKILKQSREKNPALKIILLEPFAYVENQENAGPSTTIRAAILRSEQKAVRRLAKEFDAVFVPLQAVFDEAKKQREPSYWIWDGTHPTEAGHALIAREFLKATKTIFDADIEL